MESNLFIAAFFAVGVALMFLGLDLVLSGRIVVLENRLDGHAPLPAESITAAGTPQDAAQMRGVGRASWNRRLAAELARADLVITPREYGLATLLFATTGFLFGFAILKNPVIGLLGLVLGLVLPWLYVGYCKGKRANAFNDELESALTLLSNTLRSGYGLTQAIESVAKESAPPLSVEFARVVREVSLGLTVQDALTNMVRRNPSLDLEMVVTAIHVNYEAGGNLSEVLDRIAETIRDRVRMLREVRAITSQQRLSAVVLVLLSPIVSLIVFALSPGYIALLWQNTCGILMLVTAGSLLLLGLLVIRKILDFKY